MTKLIYMLLASSILPFSVGFASDFNTTLKELFCEKVSQEKRVIEKNRIILSRIEKDLDQKTKNGMLEQEMCIRNGISALKTVDYAYSSIMARIDMVDCNDLRMKSLNELQRVRDVNKLFADVNMKIEECLLKQSITAKNSFNNEMIKDEVVVRKEAVKLDTGIPIDYPAARSPFR